MMRVQKYPHEDERVCSKHVEDNLIGVNERDKGASCWSFSRRIVAMRGSENVEYERYLFVAI